MNSGFLAFNLLVSDIQKFQMFKIAELETTALI
jgi:hypothetical protein